MERQRYPRRAQQGSPARFYRGARPRHTLLARDQGRAGQVEFDLPQYEEHFLARSRRAIAAPPYYPGETAQIYRRLPDEIIEKFHVAGDTYGDPNQEGRVIAAEFDDYWVVTCYTPNSKGDSAGSRPLRPLGQSLLGILATASSKQNPCCTAAI